jgi:methylmalonyl-CoA mutase C-terminal domain/subunit
MTLFPDVIEELRSRGLGELPVFAGGIVGPEDIAPLAEIGVEKVFPPGSRLPDIVTWLRRRLGIAA